MSSKFRTVMLLDDDPDFLEINKTILESGGYRVVCVSTPDAAWERLSIERPDLIIADLMMDTMDAGFVFARKVKGDAGLRDIPLIILTAIARRRGMDFTPRTGEDLAAMGADAFVEKPVSASTLLAKVRELLPPEQGHTA